jgi:pimeloyl-ACP methyl ester carboxylesterase
MKTTIIAVIVLILIAIGIFASGAWKNKKDMSDSTSTTTPTATAGETYVLVHGAWQDEHAWDKVKPLLEAQGNKVVTVNLPGHGTDATPVSQISLANYVDAVTNAVNQEPGQVVLVGHSMAGLVVSEVAEKIPSKIKYLVYVAAYLPKNGDDLTSLSKTDATSKIGPNLEFSKDYSTATIKKTVLVDAFCADCSQEEKDALLKNHKAEPTKPLQEKAVLTDANFGSVAKYYIETTKDFAVGNPLQKKMVADNGTVKQVFTMETSHLPFIVQPQQFVDILLGIGK